MPNRKAQTGPKWVIAGFVGIAVAAAAAWGFYVYFEPKVDVTDVVEAPVVEAFYATGTVSADHEYSIRASTSGIVKLTVDKGSVVKKGDLLAEVQNSELQFEMDRDKAQLHREQMMADDQTSPVLAELRSKLKAASDMLEIAQDDEKRLNSLRGGGGASQSDLDTSSMRVKTQWSDVEALKSQIASQKIDLQKNVEVAQAALSSAQWNLDQASLRSPIDGTVLDWPISNGTRVAVNDPILRLADVTPAHLVMRAQVDEEDKNKLRPPAPGAPGQTVKMTLYAYPNEILTGTLEKIYDKADPDRRTYEVDVKFDRPDLRLAAGMTGELNFIVASADKALVVPTQAVQGGEVFVVRDGHLQKPKITTGLRSIERTQILSGLAPGDRIVISPTMGLSEGQAVREHYIDPTVAGNINKPKDSDSSFKGFNG
jgi:multidrug efflux pump subunit AcrA (membrane-fusion protein)